MYSFFGFVFFGLASTPLVEWMTAAMRAVARTIHGRLGGSRRLKKTPGEVLKKGTEDTEPPADAPGAWQILVAAGLSCVWLVIMGAAFLEREGWELGSAFYWAFVTSTSIGFGDMSPDASKNWAFTFILIPIGLCVLAAFHEVVAGVLMPDSDVVFALSKGWANRLCCCFKSGRIGVVPADNAGSPSKDPQHKDNVEVEAAPKEKEAGGPSSADVMFLVLAAFSGIVIILLIGGAFLGSLERDTERAAAEQWWVEFNRTFTESTMAALPGDVHGNATAVMQATGRLIASLERMGTCDFPDADHSNWDLAPATFYLFTALSTVGYGSFNVQTDGGKRFVVIFAALFLWLFAAALTLLADCITPRLENLTVMLGPELTSYAMHKSKQLVKKFSRSDMSPSTAGESSSSVAGGHISEREQQFYNLVYYAFVLVATFVFLATGAALFSADPALDLKFSDGFWFIAITASTVGFGDLTPDFVIPGPAILELMYIVLGFVVVNVAVGVFTDAFDAQSRSKLSRRLSAIFPANVAVALERARQVRDGP